MTEPLRGQVTHVNRVALQEPMEVAYSRSSSPFTLHRTRDTTIVINRPPDILADVWEITLEGVEYCVIRRESLGGHLVCRTPAGVVIDASPSEARITHSYEEHADASKHKGGDENDR